MEKISPCTRCQSAQDDSCHLNAQLVCRNDPELSRRFQGFHIPLRISIFAMLIYAGYITGRWWMLVAYAIGFVLNFGLLETRYLCRHCPFYDQEGFLLNCPTLKGMPKWWTYDPGPLTKGDRILQAISGGFVDMFPFVAVVATVISIILKPIPVLQIIVFASMTITVIVFMVIMGNMLMNDLCKKCINLSCPMNKVPDDLREAYLAQNDVMREACGKDS